MTKLIKQDPATIDPLKHHSERLAERLGNALTKFYRYFDIVEERERGYLPRFNEEGEWLAQKVQTYTPWRLIIHGQRFLQGNFNLHLGRHNARFAAQIDEHATTGERTATLRAQGLDFFSRITVYEQPQERHYTLSVNLDDILTLEIPEDIARRIAKDFYRDMYRRIEREFSHDKIQVCQNFERFPEGEDLLAALIQDPSLDPADFFTGYIARPKRERLEPVKLPVPDTAAAKQKLREEIGAIQSDPDGLNVISFGNDESIAAGQASSAISDWQIRQAMSPPLSFQYMKQISALISEINRDNGTTAGLIEQDRSGDYTTQIAGKLRQIASIGRKAKDEIPKDLEATEEQMRQEQKARRIIGAHAEITDAAYTLFHEALPELKEIKLNPDSESDEKRFSAGSLDMKAQTLQQTRLITKQTAASLQHTFQPIGEALLLALPQMMNDVTRQMQFAQRVHEVIAASKIAAATEGSAAFAAAVQGVTLHKNGMKQLPI